MNQLIRTSCGLLDKDFHWTFYSLVTGYKHTTWCKQTIKSPSEKCTRWPPDLKPTISTKGRLPNRWGITFQKWPSIPIHVNGWWSVSVTCLSWHNKDWTLCRCATQQANKQHVLHTGSRFAPAEPSTCCLTCCLDCCWIMSRDLQCVSLSLLLLPSGGGLTSCFKQLNCGRGFSRWMQKLKVYLTS